MAMNDSEGFQCETPARARAWRCGSPAADVLGDASPAQRRPGVGAPRSVSKEHRMSIEAALTGVVVSDAIDVRTSQAGKKLAAFSVGAGDAIGANTCAARSSARWRSAWQAS
jgi:hypothetical protein